MAIKTPAELLAGLEISFPDNTVGSITPAVQRDYLTDLVDSSTIDITGQGWEDLVSPFTALKGAGSSIPTYKDMGNGIYGMNFDPGDSLFATYHVPHLYKIGSDVYPHVHWLCDIPMTAGDQVVWTIKYVTAPIGGSLTATTTTAVLTHTSDGTEGAGQHIITEVNPADAFPLPEIDALLMLEVEMTSSTVTGTEQIFGLVIDLHMEVDGRRTSTKASPFLKQD
jgi:hypothetical protein